MLRGKTATAQMFRRRRADILVRSNWDWSKAQNVLVAVVLSTMQRTRMSARREDLGARNLFRFNIPVNDEFRNRRRPSQLPP